MTEKIQSKVEQIKKKSWSLFDDIASRYDLMNRISSFGIDKIWRKELVESLPKSVKSILDVATGTGDLAICLKKRRPDAKVVGIDLSQEMLKIAETKAKGLNIEIDFFSANGKKMPFGDESFEALSIAFGIRNIDDIEEALREFYRVLEPGGSLRILELSLPKSKRLRFWYLIYFRWILPLIGKVVTGKLEAYQYLNQSVEEFISPEGMKEIIEKVGFKEVDYKMKTLGVVTQYSARK